VTRTGGTPARSVSPRGISGSARDVETQPVDGRHRNWGRIAVAIVLVVIIAAVVIDNRDDTRIGYVVGDVRAPLYVLLVITALLGALIGWLVLHRPHRHEH
jgi:uncharacterized integral membrane protein